MEDLLKMHKDINGQIEKLVEYYKAEFNSKMINDKLIFKTKRCGNPSCKFCPHGPYWYRAAFNKKTKKYMFQYIGSKITETKLKWYEKKSWERIKFYNSEAKRMRDKKIQISKTIRMSKKLTTSKQ